MFHDLEAQFLENVLPAYKAFEESLKSDRAGLNSDLRLARDAAFALFTSPRTCAVDEGQNVARLFQCLS